LRRFAAHDIRRDDHYSCSHYFCFCEEFCPVVLIDAVIVLEVLRCMLLYMLEVIEGVHDVLEPLEVMRCVR